MGQDLAKNFVHLCRCGLTPQMFSELTFNHAERRLDVIAVAQSVCGKLLWSHCGEEYDWTRRLVLRFL